MSAAMTVRDESAGAAANRYYYTRVVELAGHTVRACIERDFYLNQSCAVAEALNDQMTWTSLAADAPANWWYDTPSPDFTVHAATVLGPLTDTLLARANEILAAPPTTRSISPHVHGAIGALLATSHGFDAEHCVGPADIDRAYNHGGAFHIVEHPDGGVTFTKAHREDCPFIISRGARDCDEECCFPHPADTSRKSGRWSPQQQTSTTRHNGNPPRSSNPRTPEPESKGTTPHARTRRSHRTSAVLPGLLGRHRPATRPRLRRGQVPADRATTSGLRPRPPLRQRHLVRPLAGRD